MFKILTLNNISSQGLNQLPRELYEVASEITNPDGILVRSQNMHTMEVPHTVKVIGRAGAGVNNIPIQTFTERGIPVLNTPGANANAVRELVIAGMLLASRNICQSWDYVRQLKGTSADMDKQVEQNKKQFVGSELLGKTLGIVGLGNIGVKVANAALKLGMHVVGFDPTITVSRAWELSSKVKQAHNLDDLLMESDFISFHVPLTAETKNMISASRIHLMKDGVVLLNFARDGLIDKDALIEALNKKKVSVYVNDFPCADLNNHPSVISLPHLGASTKEAEENCAFMITKQVRDFLETGAISNSVNFPSIEMSSNPGTIRLAISNVNIPNMVAQISSKLAAAKLNIVSLMNKSRDDIAYTLIDVSADVNDDLMKNIASIEGVLQVRKIGSF
jgi:D-3-phosphoglycerate dehydrogenase